MISFCHRCVNYTDFSLFLVLIKEFRARIGNPNMNTRDVLSAQVNTMKFTIKSDPNTNLFIIFGRLSSS